MKRVFVIVGALLLMTTAVFAEDAAFTTAYKNGSVFVEQNTFNLNQTPWLHIKLPSSDADLYDYFTWSYWNYPAPNASYPLSNYFSIYPSQKQQNGTDLYLAFADATWDTLQKVGDWNISAATIVFKPGSPGTGFNWTTLKGYSGNVAFKVVPEPVSTSLFVIGGAVLALGAFRKRNG